ncbi:Mu transposase C-terminal domain-containing protein [Pseudomonas sp. GV071]|uniref:Mu transposase C-terminal domain-containing protein n=1 Tax=Pseudomonas sp. GV071 TaxID=2135754 RepID=UPI000D38D361|nr:Mu transposase C-terminal domain-containing protein [Pseudomonas sp. GV071]
MKIQKGDRFLYGGRVWAYVSSLSETSVQLYCESDHKFIETEPSNLEPVPPTSILGAEPRKKQTGASLAEWELAESRHEKIKQYLQQPERKGAFKELTSSLSLSVPQTYVLLRQYDENEGPKTLLRAKRGRPAGTKFLPQNIEAIISAAIKSEWKGPGSTIVSIYKRVEEMCRCAGEQAPSYTSIKKRLYELPESDLARSKIGFKRANDKYAARPKSNISERPLAKWQMDHCMIDCIIVDEKTRKPLCRPWATLIIDINSRVVPGYYLSLDAPSSYNVAMAISHAVLPKGKWIEALEDEDIKYPYYGKPEEIAMDNAKEFKSTPFRIAAKKNNIKLAWRPIGKPWWGGHIERLNGTLNMSYINFLPGMTLSNVVLRGDYDSEGKACLTFSEFRLWFARAIQAYHHTKHRMLNGKSPHEKWIEGWTDDKGALSHPALINNANDFMIDFLPEQRRVISRQGIEIWGVKYWSPALASFISNRKHSVKYNPYSLRHVWVNPSGGRYIQVAYSDITRPNVSLEELKSAKRELARDRKSGSRATSEEVFLMVRKNRELVDRSKALTKKAKKTKEHRENATGFDVAARAMPACVNIEELSEPENYTSAVNFFPVDV